MPVINGEERTDLQNCMPQVISSLFVDEEYAFEAFILMKEALLLKTPLRRAFHLLRTIK